MVYEQKHRYSDFGRNYARFCKGLLSAFWKSPVLESTLSVRDCFDARKLILTGSGIGYAAARSLYSLFCSKSDIMFGVELMSQSDLNYFPDPRALGADEPNTPLVILLSESPYSFDYYASLNAVRSVAGNCISICAQGDSREKLISLGLDPDDPNYLVKSYVGMLFALIGIIFRIARVRGTVSELELSRTEQAITDYLNACQGRLAAIDGSVLDFAKKCGGKHFFEYIADWDHAGCAQFLGVLGAHTLGLHYDVSDSEGWCHINVWEKYREEICTVSIGDSHQSSFSRLLETTSNVRILERPYLFVTDAPTDSLYCSFIPEAPAEYPWLTAFADFLPVLSVMGLMGCQNS